ncbi:hypothetical protein AAZX31_08G123400 [Glycine max]
MSPNYMLVLLIALVLAAVSSLVQGSHPIRHHKPPHITRYPAPHIHKPKPPNVATTNTYAGKKPPTKG